MYGIFPPEVLVTAIPSQALKQVTSLKFVEVTNGVGSIIVKVNTVSQPFASTIESVKVQKHKAPIVEEAPTSTVPLLQL